MDVLARTVFRVGARHAPTRDIHGRANGDRALAAAT